jgi:integrase-like protein
MNRSELSVSYWARQGCELEKYSHSELTIWILNAILSMSVTRFLRVLWTHQRVRRAWLRCLCRSIWRSVSSGFWPRSTIARTASDSCLRIVVSARSLRTSCGKRSYAPLLVSLGIPLAGFHAFRHGVATTLIDQGASITTVGAQLRHSDPRITLELYAHVVPQSQRDAVEGLASALGSGQLLTQQLNADLAQRKSFGLCTRICRDPHFRLLSEER